MPESRISRPPSYFQGPQALSAHQAPPSYQAIYANPEERCATTTLPTKHHYALGSGGLAAQRQPWLTLELSTRPTMEERWKHTPRYFGGDNILGNIKLALDGSLSINAITIVVRGRITTRYLHEGPYAFLEHSVPVWQPPVGESVSSNKKRTGTFDIPFSFPFPLEVDIAQNTKSKPSEQVQTCYPVPQSFLEKGVPVNIDYELAVRVKHGLFRPDTKLKVPIVFIPEITPEPASPRRQAAYTEGVFQLPSPISDPEGWFAVEPCTISGRLDSNLEVDVQCMLHLARPLCYARGTVIPCYMTLLCRNTDALERLSKPELQRVFLTRRVTYFKNVMKDIERHVVGKKITPLEHTDVVEVAVWWVQPLKTASQDQYSKVLEGEVHLSQALVPSSTFLAFCVQYTVDVRPFNSPEFKPASTSSPGPSTTQSRSQWERYGREESDPSARAVLSHPVTIATFNAREGPIPTPYSDRPQQSLTGSRARDVYEDSAMTMGGIGGLLPSL